MPPNRRGRRLQVPRQILEELNDVRQMQSLAGVRKRTRQDLRRTTKGLTQKSRSAPSMAHSLIRRVHSRANAQNEQAHGPVAEDIADTDVQGAKGSREPSTYDEVAQELSNDAEAPCSLDATNTPIISRAIRDRLAEDDAEIAALERRLGKKGKRTGMDSLLDELGAGASSSESENNAPVAGFKRKRNAEFEDWLRSKRQANTLVEGTDTEDRNHQDSSSFASFESIGTEEKSQPTKSMKENPYLPPITDKITKYVPPSLRQMSGSISNAADIQIVQRKLQGLLNKLSESNLVEIVKMVETMFRSNPRNDVSTALIDLLMGVLADTTSLSDTFIILHAGFIAAMYRTVGVGFTARFVQTLIEKSDPDAQTLLSNGKQQANLIATLAELYNFHVVGSGLIYDFIRILTRDLSEESAELLLKIIRSSGPQLRQDDPSSLTDVVMLLQSSVKRVGEDKLSVRAKFMIETITDLKNNRMKTGIQASSLRAEHVVRMKKLLVSLNLSKAIPTRPVEPFRVGLDDIRNHESRGKWWLIGASYRNIVQPHPKDDAQVKKPWHDSDVTARQVTIEGDGLVQMSASAPNISMVARSLGMNTQIRRVLFMAVMTSSSIDESYTQIMKLSLSRKQLFELGTVLTRCVAAEQHYNPYYTAIAQKFSGHRDVRKFFWNPLIELLTSLDNSEHDEGYRNEQWWSDAQARYNVAQFYGRLIGDGTVSLGILKNRSILGASADAQIFLELLFVSVFASIGKNLRRLQEVVSIAESESSATWMNEFRVFIETTVASTDLVDFKQKRVIRWCSEVVLRAIHSL